MAEKKKRVLFVCIGNSCRSPMAEALARHEASDVIDPASAGLSPLGYIAEPTRAVLRERGVRPDGLSSKGLSEVDPDSSELIVNLTGMPGRSLFPGARVVDWEIDDPYGEDLGVYRRACDDIAELVRKLAEELREERRKRTGRPASSPAE